MNALKQNPIGVFDSGVGGLTTLETLQQLLPQENFLYAADFSHAPYGTKSRDEIIVRAEACAMRLIAEGAKAIVAACNTATAAGIETLRAQFDMPIVGAEPALKPACETPNVRSVLVMLTPAAAAQPKFRALTAEFPNVDIRLLTVPTLAADVESRIHDRDALRALTFRTLEGAPRCDAVVLGCTHYVYLRAFVEEFFETVPVFDGNVGIARRVRTLLDRRALLNDDGRGRVRFLAL